MILTSVTTALGLMPMVIGLKLNFFTREIVYGAPSKQWWTELSPAIAGGLVIATILTFVVKPAMLMLGMQRKMRGQPTARSVGLAGAECARLLEVDCRLKALTRLQ